MTNRPVKSIDEVEDIESVNMYRERRAAGFPEEEILHSINTKGRDNARTPMQWDDSKHAGFTTGTPWLPVNDNYHEVNVKQALADPDSIFYTYQKLIQLRKDHPLIVWGEYELIETEEAVFAYYRQYQGEKWLIVVNMSEQEQRFSLKDQVKELIISNNLSLPLTVGNLVLQPYDAFVARV